MAGVSDYKITDHLMHIKTNDGQEMIAFPFTRYDNILGSPKIVNDLSTFKGAPFFFYQTDEVDVDDNTINIIMGTTVISV